MLYIDSKTNEIAITRGDSAYITITLDLKDVELRECDLIRCQVRKQPSGGYIFFEGVIEREDGIIWHIRPEDTKRMRPGEYCYDIQIELADSGDVFTVIPVSMFRILDEVTEVI